MAYEQDMTIEEQIKKLENQAGAGRAAQTAYEVLQEWLDKYRRDIFQRICDPANKDTIILKWRLIAADQFEKSLVTAIVNGKLAEEDINTLTE